MTSGTLYFFCGKMGAGKSTESARLAREKQAVLLSEDEWLSGLYPAQIHNIDDYLHYSARLKPLMAALVTNLLQTGSDVVMDFPANTIKQRQWFKSLYQAADARGEMTYLEVSDELCLSQIARRRLEQPERAAFDNEAVFKAMSSRFQEPDDDEGLTVRRLTRKS